ncbi:hypothetical protein TCE0_022r06571 [Talaromyces pinophilus]|uniref:NADP-dependent oxidoreductase domain-containing protein n=1 Tax=Talaromyces pinophilus TaxID=128442 RepID=A0A6V8H7G6_TALPI|nr:hypothetical protein TCE0_022r06571 [Talaromyces pinophilus]
MQPPTRRLGTNGPSVTAIGYGMMGLSAFYGKRQDDETRLQFLDKLYAAGQRFWDTSDIYGDSEDLLGKWFRLNPEKRQHIFLATKFGNMGGGNARTDPDYVLEACGKSLKRLRTDYIDLYYVHRADPGTPIEETVRAMDRLKKYVGPPLFFHCQLYDQKADTKHYREGKIRFLGLSEVSSSTLQRAHSVSSISAVQVEYSPFALEIESQEINLLATCKELGVAVVAYSPLGRGFLTGQLKSIDDLDQDDFRRKVPRYWPENFHHNVALVQELEKFAKQKGCTTSQLVLAWLMKQWDMVIPIPGTTKWENFTENMGSLQVDLSDDEARKMRNVIEKAGVVGDRYPDGWARTLFADTAPLP